MSLGELTSEALRAIRAHTLRSFLTLLGIIIGVATLVGVVSVITGLNEFVRERIIQLAPDVYVVQRFGILRSRQEFLDALKRKTLDWNDYVRVRDTLQRADAVAAEAVSGSAVKHRDRRLADI
jgi:putative ABC transport system permease protein